MLNLQTRTTAGHARRISLLLTAAALLLLPLADIDLADSNPWAELGRIGWGMLTPDFFAVDTLLTALLNTLAFALLGVAVANLAGFLLALIFHWRAIQYLCALVRSIHELFWALLFLQLFGLGSVTGLLAIAIPYTGIFAKVYAEILEGTDQRPAKLLPRESDWVSAFLYARIPPAFRHLKNYSLYRLECGIRSSAILGFIGLPTLGFHLETAFSQGLYSQASALLYLFFLIIASLRGWMRPRLLPLYIIAAMLWLPFDSHWSMATLGQFFSQEIVPAPLRQGDSGLIDGMTALGPWFWLLLTEQALPGVFNTLVLSVIALLGTALIALLSFPWISNQFLPRYGRLASHLMLVALRSTPELILTFVLVLVAGPSMLPAIIALSMHNGAIIGHLMGRHSDGLTLRDDACHGVNRYLYEVLPRIYGQFLAFLLYRWEVIMRESAILGLLGIHTLGFFIDSAFEELRFDRAMLLILITALLNIGVDQLSRRLRRGLVPTDQPVPTGY